VLADRAMRWLDGFWRGKTLAFTITGLTIVLAACWLVFTGFPAADGTSGSENEAGRFPPD
jgi:hypothetical protein